MHAGECMHAGDQWEVRMRTWYIATAARYVEIACGRVHACGRSHLVHSDGGEVRVVRGRPFCRADREEARLDEATRLGSVAKGGEGVRRAEKVLGGEEAWRMEEKVREGVRRRGEWRRRAEKV